MRVFYASIWWCNAFEVSLTPQSNHVFILDCIFLKTLLLEPLCYSPVTGNPQTHNQSLLLMATIASLYPERVLHNIMPVFTFMGANVLRQDDNYSFQVIQQVGVHV